MTTHHDSDASQAPRVLLMGHCVPDAYALRMALSRFVPDREFDFVNDDTAFAARGPEDIMLINRVLDGRFATQSGLDLIKSLAPFERPRAALISDIEKAQEQARELGAGPGFGKSQMNSPQAKACLEALLAHAPAS